MEPTKLMFAVAAVAAVMFGCLDTAQAHRIRSTAPPPVIHCKTEFGYTGTTISITSPLATASGGEGTLTMTPATTVNDPHIIFTNPRVGVKILGEYTVVDERGRNDSCTATLTVVEPPEINCSFIFSGDRAGTMRTLSLPGPVAHAKKGRGTLTITPESVTEGMSYTLEVPWLRSTTFTVTDEGHMTDSCEVFLEAFVSETEAPTPMATV
eukprot:jgi/Undpi1/5249/HiC_scaffold_2.g00530.m1